MKTNLNNILSVITTLITTVVTEIKDVCVSLWETTSQIESVIVSYITREFNLPVFFDEDTKKVLTSYNYGSAVKASKNTVMARFNKMALLQNQLYEATHIQAEKLGRLNELTELENLVKELNKMWSQDHFGEKPNFPENQQLFDLRQEIIATNEDLVALQKEYWAECSSHKDKFGEFLDKEGISKLYDDSYERESYAEAIRMLMPVKYISDIKIFNSLNLDKKFRNKDHEYDEEAQQAKRDTWYAEDRTLEAEDKKREEKSRSKAAEKLLALETRLYKIYRACGFMEEYGDLENVTDVDALVSLNREMLNDDSLSYSNGKRPNMWSIFFTLFDLYDNGTLTYKEFFLLCNAEDPEEFKGACQSQHEAVEYLKECYKKGEINVYKKGFFSLSNIYNKANITLVINDVEYTFPTVQGAIYALMLDEKKATSTYVKMLAAADTFDKINIAKRCLTQSHIIKKDYKMSDIKKTVVANMLESNDAFKKALNNSKGLKFKSNDCEWDACLEEARQKLFEEQENRIAEIINKLLAEKAELENSYAHCDLEGYGTEEVITAKYRIAKTYLTKACEIAQTMVMRKEELA